MSVQTYQSHRTSAQRVVQQEYTVDENGASLNALSRNSDGAAEEQLPTASPTTSIYIRDWKVHFFSTPAPHHPCRIMAEAYVYRSGSSTGFSAEFSPPHFCPFSAPAAPGRRPRK